MNPPVTISEQTARKKYITNPQTAPSKAPLRRLCLPHMSEPTYPPTMIAPAEKYFTVRISPRKKYITNADSAVSISEQKSPAEADIMRLMKLPAHMLFR